MPALDFPLPPDVLFWLSLVLKMTITAAFVIVVIGGLGSFWGPLLTGYRQFRLYI